MCPCSTDYGFTACGRRWRVAKEKGCYDSYEVESAGESGNLLRGEGGTHNFGVDTLNTKFRQTTGDLSRLLAQKVVLQ